MSLAGLRERIPYQFNASDKDDILLNVILDEQEQDELIHKLREENRESNKQTRIALQILLGISSLLQLVYVLNSSKESPLNAIWPPTGPSPKAPIPLILSTLAIFIHADMFLLLHHHRTRLHVYNINLFFPLPHTFRYALSAVAPALCLSHGCSWQTVLWWSVTGTIAFVVQTVETSLQSAEDDFARLEKLKYKAPGA